MPSLAHLLCPTCGKQLPGDAADPFHRPPCDVCGQSIAWWEKPESGAVPLLPSMSVRKPSLPAADAPIVKSKPRWHVRLPVVVGVVALLTVVGWGYTKVRATRERTTALLANQVVAAKVETARAHMARQGYDAALAVLEDALATENATDFEGARVALVQARQGQADLLLDHAAAAVAHRKIDEARRLLKDYLTQPYAGQKPKAERLLNELALATAEQDAVELLANSSDERLKEFAETGRLAGGEQLTDEGMRALYTDTLRRFLPAELQRREARREAARAEALKREREQVEREERLRASALFQEVTTFATGIRKQQRERELLREREERALELFFQSTGVTDPAEKQMERDRLRAGREGADLALVVVRKKAQVKKDYRQSKDYDHGDEETFDRLVDQELDRLLGELKGMGARWQ